jgi:acyl-CoA thioesterase-1
MGLLFGCSSDSSAPAEEGASTARAEQQATPQAAGDSARGSGSAAATSATDSAADSSLRVLVLGNSIAAGAGVDSRAAFPALLQQKVDSLGWAVTVRNAGLSGETTAGGRRRVSWLLRQPVDILVLELGGNDGLRGVDPSATQENLTAIVDTTLARYPEARVLLCGMQVPPNLGPEYTRKFRDVYPAVAQQYEQVTLLPFLLEGVGGVPQLMQDDGIHPNAEGQRKVAANVWEYLRPMLERMRQQTPA